MPEHRTSAVVLTSREYGEIDRIVTFYTRDFGKVIGIAKGARKSQKRFGAALDFLSHVDLSFFAKETLTLVRIGDCQLQNSFTFLHEDIRRMAYGSYFAELVTVMTAEGVPHQGLFQMLVRFLHILDTTSPKEDYLHIFEIRILDALGYRPSLDRCTGCKREIDPKDHPRFSVSRGGVMCSHCGTAHENLYPVSPGTIRLLQQSYRLSLNKIQRLVFSPKALEESREFLNRFIQYHTEKELNAMKFIEKVSSDRCARGFSA
jgi:DNA repair protein RecO (recombination protein O)